jgi:hypothetical protein
MSRWLALWMLLALACDASAQLRTLPAEAKRGTLRHVEDMVIEIDGARERLAPGARIRDASNLIIVPAAIPAGAQAKYMLDHDGRVREVWILTREEAGSR